MKLINWLKDRYKDKSPAMRKINGTMLMIASIVYLFINPDYSIFTIALGISSTLLGVGNITDIWKLKK